jgi:hypothetical protein
VEQTKPEEATLLLIATIDHGWHVYAQETRFLRTDPFQQVLLLSKPKIISSLVK